MSKSTRSAEVSTQDKMDSLKETIKLGASALGQATSLKAKSLTGSLVNTVRDTAIIAKDLTVSAPEVVSGLTGMAKDAVEEARIRGQREGVETSDAGIKVAKNLGESVSSLGTSIKNRITSLGKNDVVSAEQSGRAAQAQQHA